MHISFFIGGLITIIGFTIMCMGIDESVKNKMSNKTGEEITAQKFHFGDTYKNGKKVDTVKLPMVGSPEYYYEKFVKKEEVK